jgi:8-oxo-dGTP pyrophosphatase MutT (NUDIX family)
MALNKLKRTLFWIVSRVGLFLYARFPIFGPLRAAMGILRKDATYLVIERNDGRGLSFPGGLLLPWEGAEQAVVREILEETGLTVSRSSVRSHYYSSADIPVNVTVFDIEAEGQLRGSWEGMPFWLPLSDLRQRIIPAQRRIVEMLV